MDEEGQNLDDDQLPEEPREITPQQLARFKNLKAFRGWTDQEIVDYIKNRDKNKVPEPKPDQRIPLHDEDDDDEAFTLSDEDYQKKYEAYYKKYTKEYAVDMNETNDVQALQSLVRFILQSELVDINIRKTQSSKHFSSKVLKDMGDFQRSLQMSIKEVQEQLGISRKARKERQVDDIPQYIRQLQLKATEKWKRSTKPIMCDTCHIELARYWLNFPDRVEELGAVIICDKCEQTVVWTA